jgi:broad specificity phosphatase PhoE
VFIRHGETYGNCGQSTADGKIDIAQIKSNIKNSDLRIFQGDVDTEINQLTLLGKHQAELAAVKLEEELLNNNWIPQIIFHSPLNRAKDTGLPFINRNNFKDIYFPHNGIKEMSFGSWDNQRVCDLRPTDPCHSFYRNQNALIRDERSCGESFCDLLHRTHHTLMELNEQHPNKKIIMFSHSMFGAACCILLGKGQIIEMGKHLAFDGKRANGEYYTMPHVTPFLLNGDMTSARKLSPII